MAEQKFKTIRINREGEVFELQPEADDLNATPLIVLDFDGVIVTPATQFKCGDPLCVAQLNRITDAVPNVKILVSSAWRFKGVVDMRQTLMGWGVKGDVVAVTPDLNCFGVEVERGVEIGFWINTAPFPVGNVVILDDDADMADMAIFLVQTDPKVGLTITDADEAIARLTEELP